MSSRFLRALRRFRDNDDGEKNRLYRLAREALSFFTGTATRDFVLQMVYHQVFGVSRLHTVVNLNYFEVDAVILLDNVLGDAADGNMVAVTACNFESFEVAHVMRLAAIHSRDVKAILSELSKSELFDDYDVSNASERWTERRVWKFIRLLSLKSEVPIPHEAFPLRARFAADEALKLYDRGEIEILDFSIILSAVCGSNEELFVEIANAAGSRFKLLGEYLARRRNLQLTCASDASDFQPTCNNNRRLHNMASGESRVLVLPADISDFRQHLRESKFFAIVYRLKGMTGIEEMDFITIRVKRRTYHLSSFLSHSVLGDFMDVLAREMADKTDFVNRGGPLLDFLYNKFRWSPSSVVDAAVLAKQNGVRDTVNSIAEAISGGPFCWRACVFGDTSDPSSPALKHHDVNVCLIYEFCIEFGKFAGEEMRHSVAYHDAYPSPSRRRNDARESRGKKRKRSSSSRSRSRSRPRK